jgi:hypothetical protein
MSTPKQMLALRLPLLGQRLLTETGRTIGTRQRTTVRTKAPTLIENDGMLVCTSSRCSL